MKIAKEKMKISKKNENFLRNNYKEKKNKISYEKILNKK